MADTDTPQSKPTRKRRTKVEVCTVCNGKKVVEIGTPKFDKQDGRILGYYWKKVPCQHCQETKVDGN